MSRRRSGEIVIILWRDIPAQVNGREGATRHQVVLPHRFQKAIDRAAMVADKKTAHEYVAEWRRETLAAEGDLATCVDALVTDFRHQYTIERLQALVDNGGWEAGTASVSQGDPT